MWDKLAVFILKFRFLIIAIIAVLTFFIAQHSVNVQLSVDRAKILPSSHKEYIDNEKFQKKYGENHVIAIAISDPEFYFFYSGFQITFFVPFVINVVQKSIDFYIKYSMFKRC